MNTTQIVHAGRYDYDLAIKFPSTYIPDHTPPSFRGQAAQQTTRTRRIWGQFDLSEEAPHDALRDHFVRKTAEELMIPAAQIEITQFDLTPAK